MLEILLVEDGEVLFRFPVLEEGLHSETMDDLQIDRLSDLCSVGANRKRLKVMLELAKGKEMLFSDVMQIVTNPKLAQDCLQPLLKEGLVLHGGRGSTYRVSGRGQAFAVAMTIGMGGMLDVLENELEKGT